MDDDMLDPDVERGVRDHGEEVTIAFSLGISRGLCVWPISAAHAPTYRRVRPSDSSIDLILSLAAVTGCEATTSLPVSPTVLATTTRLPPPKVTSEPTATLAPEDAFRDEIAAITDLRAQVPATRPNFAVEQVADVTIMHVFIQLSSPALSDLQWDAFDVQRALRLGQEFAIPDGWEVSVEFFVPPTNSAAQTLGSEVGVANLYTASARRFAWESLSPQQAWSRHDSVAFNQNGR